MTDPSTDVSFTYDDSAEKVAKAAVAYFEAVRKGRVSTHDAGSISRRWIEMKEAADEYVARQPKAWTSTTDAANR